MPYRREGDDYVHHQPKSGNGRAMQPSRASSSTETSMPPQYTWLEGLWMAIVSISYLLGYGIQISIIVEKYSLGDDRPPNCGLYIFFFLVPHIMAGLKNLQYHYREAMEEDGEDSSLGWIINIVFLPFSPLIRFVRAWRFGMGEKDNWEDGIRYVDEMVTVGVLRLFEVFLGDGPTLCLLLRDDVWGRSTDWSETINGPQNQVRCGPQCSLQPQNPIQFWTVFRMIFLLSKMAQCVTFYIVIVKRLQRLQHPEHFRNQRNASSRQGRVNLFATLILYIAHFFFIGSRVIGYSMVDTAWGGWVYLIVGAHWLLNTAWHLITLLNSNGITAARYVSLR
ncbi:uncharacterized protein LOC121863731 [Homarus americanus]|uniref:uncharacterized protein LOC121863731 n=1 Tax=Homarus americanus TaxID=6706 RepID=UPI001C43F4AA|nr:uncharacterized protein LOC121863731 [Homarus americanus]XP_042218416.1 uncharacterized protein LOC121863731 [Homarus americanus]